MSVDTTRSCSVQPEAAPVSLPLNGQENGDDLLSDDAIAVIGMGCRFPGAKDPNSFWQVLRDGMDTVGEVPSDRWSTRSYFAPSPPRPGKTYSRWGGFLDGIDQFDAGFFGISPRESDYIDPQQRLLLEVAWEAIENAGLTSQWLTGRSVSVFVGASSSDYLQLQSQGGQFRSINAYTNSGGALSIVSNRLSYLLDLRGPSLTVDTACSSSLVAFHYACESLRRGESEAAIVGGVNVLLYQAGFIGFSHAHMLSPDGRCRSFDASGNGYVRSEGAGVVILKPLSQAVADGDSIMAVVLGSGVNQDGRTSGMSLPNEDAQAKLLRDVYKQAKVDPGDVSYIEAHGTGTPAGDPIEAGALGRELGQGHAREEPLLIGSVKSNMGHLEPASGIAGIIKVVLAMQNRELPRTLHLQNPNPAIDFDHLRLRVSSQHEAWEPQQGVPRIAGVNSFGFGGTNAHVVLSEPFGSHRRNIAASTPMRFSDSTADGPDSPAEKPAPVLIPLTAGSEHGLRALAESWRDWLTGLRSTEHDQLENIAYTAAVRRDHHEHRLSVTCSSVARLKESLEGWLHGEKRKNVSSGQAVHATHSNTVFVFSGMGSQWQGMGEELLRTEPVFRAAIEDLDAIFERRAGWSIVDRLNDDEFRSRIDETEIAQPCIFAVQAGLAALWQHWGVTPDLVVGHSVGEVAAAYVSGVLSLDDAVSVIYHRSRLQHTLRGQGRMLAAGLPEEMAVRLIAPFDGAVSIAAVNSPSSVTLSGDASALEELHHQLEASQTFCRFLKVDVPYHSDRMEAIREELLESLAGLQIQAPVIPFYSTVTGGLCERPQLDAEYWWRNVREPVLFAKALESVLSENEAVCVEIGAHPVLTSSILECGSNSLNKVTVAASMRRQESQRSTLLTAVGQTFTLGRSVRWTQHHPQRRQVVPLPTYPWQRDSYWCEDADARRSRLGSGHESSDVLAPTSYTLLGRRLQSALQEQAWHVQLSIDSDHPWLADHQVQGVPVFPAAGMIEQALSAGRQIYPDQPLRLESVVVSKALALVSGQPTPVETNVDLNSGDFHINSRDPQEAWTRHAWGRVSADFSAQDKHVTDLSEFDRLCTVSHDVADLYAWFMSLGLNYGPGFQAIQSVQTGPGVVLGRIGLPDALTTEVDRFTLCPALLDACLQLMLAAGRTQPESADGGYPLYLPSKFGAVRVHDPAGMAQASTAELTVACRVLEKNESLVRADASILDENGKVVVVVEGFEARSFPMSQQSDQFRFQDCLFEHQWKLQPLAGEPLDSGMPAPTSLAGAVQSRLSQLSCSVDSGGSAQEFRSQVKSQATAFAVAAIRDSDCEWPVGQTVSVDTLADACGVIAAQRPLFADILQRLALANIVRQSENHVEILAPLPETNAQELWQKICRRWPSSHAEQLLAWQIGSRLTDVLSGKLSADAMSPQWNLLEQAEDDGPTFGDQCLILQTVFDELRKQLSSERPLRVLELGEGTAAMLTSVVSVLHPSLTEYTFADSSPEILQAARQKCRDYSLVRYIEFDTAMDPAEQGLQPASFDVVLCADAASAIRLTPLLASDGLLILRRGPHRTGPQDDGSQWFALRTSEPDDRKVSALEAHGFRNVVRVSGSEQHEDGSSGLWLAHAPANNSSKTTSPEQLLTEQETWVVADEASCAEPLMQRLRKSGGRPVLITPADHFRRLDSGHYELPFGETTVLADLCRSSKEEGMIPRTIVHLGAVNSTTGDHVSTDSLRQLQTAGTNMALALAQAAAQADWARAPRLWFVTQRVQSTGLPPESSLCLAAATTWGLARVLMNELPQLKCSVIDVGDLQNDIETDSLFREITAAGEEQEVVLRGRQRYVPRLETARLPWSPDGQNPSFRVAVTSRGSLDSVALVPAPREAPAAGEVEIEVAASAVNFKDVAKALQLLSEETLSDTWSGKTLGLECAGTISAVGEGVDNFQVGDRVVALAADCLRPHVITRAELITKVPEHLSFRDVAGVPVVFLTAWYALHQLARIQPGERVLIHAATGGVGLAATQIARAAGAEIFATAGSPAKRMYLRALGVEHVFDSRSLSFVDGIRDVAGDQSLRMPFPIPPPVVPYATQYWFINNSKVCRELGVRFRSARETLAETISWLKTSRHL